MNSTFRCSVYLGRNGRAIVSISSVVVRRCDGPLVTMSCEWLCTIVKPILVTFDDDSATIDKKAFVVGSE